MLLQMIILQVLTFAAIVFVLRKFLYAESAKEVQRLKKIMEENTQRRRELQRNIEASEKVYQEKMAQADEDIRKLRLKFEEDLRREKNAAINKAKDEAEMIIKAALNAKEKLREEASMEMLAKAPALASRIFVEIISPQVREMVHKELVEEVINRIKEMEKSVFAGKLDRLDIVSAYQLTKDEKAAITAAVSEKAGCAVPFGEKEEKQIIAGVIIRAGSIVIDGSMDNRLKQIGKEL